MIQIILMAILGTIGQVIGKHRDEVTLLIKRQGIKVFY